MYKKSSKISLVPILILVCLAMSAVGYAADNATITGDDVNVRSQPSTMWAVVEVLAEGTRVEVTSQMNFTETIDGHTAPWYKVRHGDAGGYVFGSFLELDPGVSVPTDETGAGYSDPIYRFTDHGVRLFGWTEADVVKKLGEPISRTKKSGDYPGDTDRTLTYNGIVIQIYDYAGGGEVVYQVSYTTDSYDFDGLKVGSSLADVERLLGVNHDHDGDLVTYNDETGYLRTSFTVRNGKVVEITFFSDYMD